jgi:hypothetical protein
LVSFDEDGTLSWKVVSLEILRNTEVPESSAQMGSTTRRLVVAPPTVGGCLVATNVKLIRRLRVRGDVKKSNTP